jgi:hypothetical protein
VGILPVHYEGPLPVMGIKPYKVFLSDDGVGSSYVYIPHIAEMERFLLPQEDGVAIDQQNMYDFAIANGFSPQQRLTVMWVTSSRPLFPDGFYHSADTEFAISELLTKRIFLSYDDMERKISDIIYRFL